MSRFILVAMTVAVTVAGCNRFPDNGLQIAANLPPTTADCVVSADQDTRLLRGLYDLSYRDRAWRAPRDYVIAPLIQSYLISNALEFQGEQAEPPSRQLRHHNAASGRGRSPTLPDGLVNPYRVDTSAVLPATSSGRIYRKKSPPRSAFQRPTRMRSWTIAADTGFESVLLEIRAGGTTFGGFSQRSAPFRWPVDLCEGCLGAVCETADELDDSCLPGQDIWPYCAVVMPPRPTALAQRKEVRRNQRHVLAREHVEHVRPRLDR